MFYTRLGKKRIARAPPFAAGHGRTEVTDRDHSAYWSPFVASDGRPVSKKRLVGRHY
jgi:hypothetical protein